MGALPQMTSPPQSPEPGLFEFEVMTMGSDADPTAFICAPCWMAIYAFTPTGWALMVRPAGMVRVVPLAIRTGPVTM